MFFYVVSRTYPEIFSLLRICSGLLSNSPGLLVMLLSHILSYRRICTVDHRGQEWPGIK